MGKIKENAPEFFEKNTIDAVNAATGSRMEARQGRARKAAADKRKAGFYRTLIPQSRQKVATRS